MKIWNRKPRALAAALLCSAAMHAALPDAVAPRAEAAEAIEEVVVTGTRGQPRSAMDSAVPVDAFSSDTIGTVSHSDTNDILQALTSSGCLRSGPLVQGVNSLRMLRC